MPDIPMQKMETRPASMRDRGMPDWPAIKCGCGVIFLWEPRKGFTTRCPTCKCEHVDLLKPTPSEG